MLQVALDFLSLLKFVLFAAGALGTAFFAVTLGLSIWVFAFYKVRTRTSTYTAPTLMSSER